MKSVTPLERSEKNELEDNMKLSARNQLKGKIVEVKKNASIRRSLMLGTI